MLTDIEQTVLAAFEDAIDQELSFLHGDEFDDIDPADLAARLLKCLRDLGVVLAIAPQTV